MSISTLVLLQHFAFQELSAVAYQSSCMVSTEQHDSQNCTLIQNRAAHREWLCHEQWLAVCLIFYLFVLITPLHKQLCRNTLHCSTSLAAVFVAKCLILSLACAAQLACSTDCLFKHPWLEMYIWVSATNRICDNKFVCWQLLLHSVSWKSKLKRQCVT